MNLHFEKIGFFCQFTGFLEKYQIIVIWGLIWSAKIRIIFWDFFSELFQKKKYPNKIFSQRVLEKYLF